MRHLPHNLTAILGEGHRGHYKYPSNLVGRYKNAALLVFLPSFSSADSQNALSQSEGRDVLGGNKRVLPPILSCGVAFPSQIRQFGQTLSNEITRRPLPRGQPNWGRTHNRCARQVCTAAVSSLSPGWGLPSVFSPPAACAPGEDDNVEESASPRGKRLPTE